MLFLANFGRTAVKFASKMCPLSSQVKKKFLLLKVYRIENMQRFPMFWTRVLQGQPWSRLSFIKRLLYVKTVPVGKIKADPA